ncbi:hypothetical protein J6590_021599 [Homalodisca vitripennis]|nr:hypothetical protein J6590_021599 [Homalodisca vitripennis]
MNGRSTGNLLVYIMAESATLRCLPPSHHSPSTIQCSPPCWVLLLESAGVLEYRFMAPPGSIHPVFLSFSTSIGRSMGLLTRFANKLVLIKLYLAPHPHSPSPPLASVSRGYHIGC